MENIIDFNKKAQEFRDFYNKNLDFHESALNVYVNLINALLVDKVLIEGITCRIKNVDESISKFKRKYLAEIEVAQIDYDIKSYITDLLGLRVVCLYLDDIKKIQSLIEENFKEIEVTDKNAQIESTDDKFGYKGLHLDLMLNDSRACLPEYSKFKDLRFELQIRTIIQDAWSVLDHKIKYKKNIPQTLKRRINRLSALFEVADEEFIRIKQETIDEAEKAKNQQQEIVKDKDNQNDTLDVFKFLSVVQSYFPLYDFIEYKADGFVGEILKIKPELSTKDFYTAIETYIEKVKDFSENDVTYMNPYTTLRHILYLSDRDLYKSILYDSQRIAFDKWLDTKK